MFDLAVPFVHDVVHQVHLHQLGASKNPFDSVVPDFSIFGAKFTSWWQKLLGAAWAAAILVCAFKLFPALASVHRSRKVGNAVSLGEASQDLQFWGMTTVGTVAAGLLFGVLLILAP